MRSTKNIVKDRAPYFILKYLKDKEATSEERAVAKTLIEESYSEKKVTKRAFNDALNDLFKGELVAKVSGTSNYYITESGIGALERCETKESTPKSQPSSPVKKGSPTIDARGLKGECALIVSLFYLGATTNGNAVMRSDAISAGKRYRDTFHDSFLDGGKHNQGKTDMNKLREKGIVKVYMNKKTINSEMYFLTEEGNKKANELILGPIPLRKPDIRYESYEGRSFFEDIKSALLCILYANGATSEETGVIYPFIVTELNHLVANIRGMDNDRITPEYAALFDLVKNGFVKKKFSKGDPDKFFLTAMGVSEVGFNDGVKIKKYLKKANERKDSPVKRTARKKKGVENEDEDSATSSKRARDVDAALESPESKRAKMSPDVPSTPLRNPRQPESALMEEETEDTDELELIGVKRGDVIYIEGDEYDTDEPPKKKSPHTTGDPPEVVCVLDDDDIDCVPSNDSLGGTSTRDSPKVRSRAELAEIDRQNALKYPPLKVYQVFMTHSSGAITPPKITEVKLIVDSNEPKYLRKAIETRFTKEGLVHEEKKLNAGDYTWVAIGADRKEYLLNAIVERKAISDFDESHRNGGKYWYQVSKMRASEINNLLYLIEGVSNRENSFHNKSFDVMQQRIRNVQEKDGLRLIRTLKQEETIDFLVDITKSLNEIAKGGRLPGEWFAYPLCDIVDMNKRIEEFKQSTQDYI